MRATPSSGVPRRSPTAALPAAIVAPQPLGVEAGVADAPLGVAGLERERDADQITAGRPAGRTGEGVIGDVAAPERVFEMAAELLLTGGHPDESRARSRVLRRSPAGWRRRR